MFDWLKKGSGEPDQHHERQRESEPEFKPAKLPPRRSELAGGLWKEEGAYGSRNKYSGKDTADMMRELRVKMLTASPAQFAQNPTPEFPRVCGVIMDWPIELAIVSVLSFCDGEASVYTTGTFGILGGAGHETVRNAAKNFVKVAERHHDEATLTTEYPYPAAGRVRFYLVCYDGVRTIETDLQALQIGNDKCSDLYLAGQHVMTEFRLLTDRQKQARNNDRGN